MTEIVSATASFFVRGSEGNSQRSLRTQARVPRITETARKYPNCLVVARSAVRTTERRNRHRLLPRSNQRLFETTPPARISRVQPSLIEYRSEADRIGRARRFRRYQYRPRDDGTRSTGRFGSTRCDARD
ncbi:hypothetical protein AS032_34085 [Rhodococcus qingshengii]|nr:hypothetical protein AOT96_32220 [Rhodococcus sp. 008]KSU61971.1 hypothetical protein AS032_34085 [Rhodococcus qingshengii]